MTPDDVIFATQFAGLGSYDEKSASISVPSVTLGAFEDSTYSASIPLDKSDSISLVQVRFNGIETVWRAFTGYLILYTPSFSSAEFSYIARGSLNGNNLTVSVTVANATSSSQTSDSFTLNIRASLFTAPF